MSCPLTVQLICAFVFSNIYTKYRFSHDTAQIINVDCHTCMRLITKGRGAVKLKIEITKYNQLIVHLNHKLRQPSCFKYHVPITKVQIYQISYHHLVCSLPKYFNNACLFEPRCEKTGLRGFRPGPTQTGMYCHRRWLEA